MPTNTQTSKAYFTQMTVIFAPLLLVQIAFGGISYYLVSTGQFPTDAEMTGIYKIVAIGILAAGVLASSFVSRAQFNNIKKKPTLAEKMNAYRSALLVKWALLEVPSLFCIVGFLLTGSYFILGLAAPAIILMINYRPTPAGACMDLELPPADKALVENPNAVIAQVGQVDNN